MRHAAVLLVALSFAATASELPPGNQMAVAIERGNLEQVKDLVEKYGLGLVIDYGEGEKVTPIAKACWDGREEIVRYLLEKGADPNGFSGSDRSTPLLEAVKRDRASIVSLLIEKGAKVNTKDTREMTPINSAAAAGNVEIVEILVKAKANLQSETYGLTPLAFAIAAKKPELVKRLVELGANVNHASKMNGQTALMGAILQGDAEMVQLLLSLKANPNARMKDGSTPMSMARNGDLDDIVAILKKAGAK